MIDDEKIRAAGAFTLPTVAAAVYLVGVAYGIVPLYASTSCYYAGQEYSDGACVQSCANSGQICNQGAWMSCSSC